MRTDANRSRLVTDQHGAIMLLGVFMAIFMTGCLFYVVGIGRTLVYRQHLQDAADAAAMAAAIGHAKGMNAIVFINIVMAALLAILVALRLISAIALAATAILLVLCAYPPLSALCVLAETTGDIATQVEELYGDLESPIKNILEALHTLEVVIRDITPAAAVLKSWDAVGTHFQKDVGCGAAIPPRLTLPTEDDTYGTLCTQAGRFTGELVAEPLNALTSDETIGGVIEDGIAALTESVPDWFCGDGESQPPTTSREHKGYHPELPSVGRCADAIDNDPEHSDAICAEAEAEGAASMPNKATGECLQNCEPDGPYAQRMRLARTACNPNRHRNISEFRYQYRVRTRHLAKVAGAWRLEDETIDELELRDADKMPCHRGRSGTEWNEDRDDGAVCTLLETRTRPARDREDVRIEEVVEVFSCARTETITFEPTTDGAFYDSGSDEEEDQGDDGDMNPQKVIEGLRSGDGEFQLRAAVYGRDRASALEHLVAMDGRKPVASDELPGFCGGASDEDTEGDGTAEGGLFGSARILGRLAVAQAEYYFAGTEPPELMMWRMKWTARLRRFRLEGREGEEESGDGGNDSNSAGGSAFDGLFGGLDGLVAH